MPDAFPTLRVPSFPRLDEYCSLWAMEPSALAAQWEAISRMDLTAHVLGRLKAMEDGDAGVTPPEPKATTEIIPAAGGRSVAYVHVVGTLMKQRSSMGGTSTVQLRREIRQAAADPSVSAILLGVDSPGGTVGGLDDLASEVRAARRNKPVWAHVEDLAASAAYWVASQAEKVYANSPTAQIGSIGTILPVYDVSDRMARDGVKVFAFATGHLKATGMPGVPVTEERAAYVQGLVDGAQAEFDKAVTQGRALTKAELAEVRTGAVFLAGEAKGRKLIDGVRPLERTIKALTTTTGQRLRNPQAASWAPAPTEASA